MAEVELHEEVVQWLSELDEESWDRTVVVIDRLAALGSTARMPLSRSLGEGLFEFALQPGWHGPQDHLSLRRRRPDRVADHLPQATTQRALRDRACPPGSRRLRTQPQAMTEGG